MGKTLDVRLRTLVPCLGVITAFLALAPLGTLAEDVLPEYYEIEGVPLYQQIDAKGCGAVSLQMVFEYYGPFIDQREIYDAARAGGTTLPDMARAAQFSSESTAVGTRFPEFQVTGYTGRSIGYAGFYYAATEEWLDELKLIVSQGYPVIVLVEWMPDYEGGDHYRVVIGYDDVSKELIMRDGWVRELKDDQEYEGSTSQLASDNAVDDEYVGYRMSYEGFLETWRECDTDIWGVEGMAYGAVLVTPWEVSISSPEQVTAGDRFTVTASVKYPCLAPFGDLVFPVFTAEDAAAQIILGEGLRLIGSPEVVSVGSLDAGDTFEVSWRLAATGDADVCTLEVLATGLVSGSLNEWKDYPAYDYEDLIGGSSVSTISVIG